MIRRGDRQQLLERIAAVPHWHHRIDFGDGVVAPGAQDTQALLGQIALPADCTGLRVLDIGARDGFFSFEVERRGAREVVAVDNVPPHRTGFEVAKELLGSRVEYVTENVYNLDPARFGRFDLVLFLGVLYHLRHPLLALDRIWDVCNPEAVLVVETHMLDEGLVDADGQFHKLAAFSPDLAAFALAQFFDGDLRGDTTTQWSPNQRCLRGLLTSAGFDVTQDWIVAFRGGASGRRRELLPNEQREVDAAVQWDLARGVVETPSRYSP